MESRTDEGGVIRGHLEACGDCVALAAEARRLLGALEISAQPAPSEALVNEVWSRILEQSSTEAAASEGRASSESMLERMTGALREVWAVLVNDSLQPVLAPVRGVSHAEPRLLVYETEQYGFSLALSSGERHGELNLIGSVLPKASAKIPEGGRARLRAGSKSDESPVAEFGEFRFADVPRGTIELEVEIGGQRIHLSADSESRGA